MLLMILFGISFAMVPLCVELSVECLYPIGQGLINGLLLIASTIAQFVCGGVLFALATEINDVEILQNNSCNISEDSDDKPKSFVMSLLALFVFYTAFAVLPLVWLQVPYKRRNLDLGVQTKDSSE